MGQIQSWSQGFSSPVASSGPLPPFPDGMILAPWPRRIGAWLFDGVLFALPGAVCAWLVGGRQLVGALVRLLGTKSVPSGQLGPLDPSRLSAQPADSHELLAALCVAGVLLLFVVGWIAYRVGLVAWKGATYGKLLLGLRVVSVDDPGRPPTLGRAFARFAVPQGAGLIPLPGTGLLAYAPAFVDARRQGAHDRAARTVVVHRPQGAGHPI